MVEYGVNVTNKFAFLSGDGKHSMFWRLLLKLKFVVCLMFKMTKNC